MCMSVQCPQTLHASVQAGSETVNVQSTALSFTPAAHKQSFLECLRALPNQTLWDSLVIDGDGTWIYEGLLHNSRVMMSDSLYDEKRKLMTSAPVPL